MRNRWISISVATVSLAGGCFAADPLLTQVKTIPLNGVEGRIDHMCADADGKRLYVAALGNNTLEVIDVAAGKRIKSINGLKKPTGIRVLPVSGNIVIASGDDGKVRIFDPSMKLLGAVNDLDDADNVRLDPKGEIAYVGYADGALAVIDPAKAQKIAEIKLDGHPESFQLESGGSRIFVNVPTAKQIAVVDRERNDVIAKWPLKDAEANFPMALDETNHRLFIGCRKPSKLLVLDTENGRAVAALDCCGDTDDLFYDAASKRIYLTGGEGCISIFGQTDANHYKSLGKISTAPGARTSLFVPATRMLYVAVPHRGNQAAEIRVYQSEAR